jgi:hypothetical protein
MALNWRIELKNLVNTRLTPGAGSVGSAARGGGPFVA